MYLSSATIGSQEGPVVRKVERSGISYSDRAKCQQDNLIICDPGLREKSNDAICRICERPNVKCQTNICQDEVRCQSEISVSIRGANTLSAAAYCSGLTVMPL